MSKLLKKVIDRHMPHLSSKLTAENGYDAAKHRTAEELHKAKLISDEEKSAIDDCVDALAAMDDDVSSANAAKVLKAAHTGEVDKDSLNDDAFLQALFNGEEGDVDQPTADKVTA